MQTLNKQAFRKKLLLQPINGWTLAPFVLGASFGLGAWAVNLHSPLTLATGLILSLISAGIYLHKLLLGWDKNYEALVHEWREKVEAERDKALDRLYTELQQDGDGRTEALLKDLRTLTKALLSEQTDQIAIDAVDILADVDLLFQRSVDYLKESLELWKMAQSMQRESIKEKLLEQREALVQEVEQSLDNLGNVLTQLKKTTIQNSRGQALADLREELASRLRIAEQVESRMASLRATTQFSNEELEYLRHASIKDNEHN